MTCTCSSTPPFMARDWRSRWKTWWRRSSPMDAWSGYWKTGARRSPATISITPTGATPPQRSLRFWRNYGPTPIYSRDEEAEKKDSVNQFPSLIADNPTAVFQPIQILADHSEIKLGVSLDTVDRGSEVALVGSASEYRTAFASGLPTRTQRLTTKLMKSS